MDDTLKNYLENKKLSAKKFASILGYSQPHICDIINGREVPSFKLAKKIETATGGEVKRTVWFPNE